MIEYAGAKAGIDEIKEFVDRIGNLWNEKPELADDIEFGRRIRSVFFDKEFNPAARAVVMVEV